MNSRAHYGTKKKQRNHKCYRKKQTAKQIGILLCNLAQHPRKSVLTLWTLEESGAQFIRKIFCQSICNLESINGWVNSMNSGHTTRQVQQIKCSSVFFNTKFWACICPFAHLWSTLGLITHCPLNKNYYEKFWINKKIKSEKSTKHKTLLMKQRVL